MVLFSERNGLVPQKILQDKDFNPTSRRLLANEIIRLFNTFRVDNDDSLGKFKFFHHDLVEYGINHAYWRHYEEAKKQLFFSVEMPVFPRGAGIKLSAEVCTNFFETLTWRQVLDILEMLIKNRNPDVLKDDFNTIFIKLGWAYKVTKDGQIISTMDDTSFESLEATLTLTGKWEGVKNHFSNAITLFKHRPEGKYKEACMASVDALDKLAKVILNRDNATLGDWIKESKNELPTQIKSKADGIYALRGGYISHGNGAEHEIEASFAKWYLVSCSALINWMIEKYAQCIS
ncbi:MAG: hypothetical protein HEQ32_06010 [Vampirovibrio sp.]